jgi:hypothetical protein
MNLVAGGYIVRHLGAALCPKLNPTRRNLEHRSVATVPACELPKLNSPLHQNLVAFFEVLRRYLGEMAPGGNMEPRNPPHPFACRPVCVWLAYGEGKMSNGIFGSRLRVATEAPEENDSIHSAKARNSSQRTNVLRRRASLAGRVFKQKAVRSSDCCRAEVSASALRLRPVRAFESLVSLQPLHAIL